jgi:hypothetical protein
MNQSEYRKKQEAAERKRQEATEDAYRQQVIGALQGIAEQNKAADYQSSRADRFHRQVEKLTLKLEKRRYRLEIAETIGLWFAAFVGLLAIYISNHDSGAQTKVMQDQQAAMQGQLDEMKGSSAQTNQMVETNRKLAEAAGKQAQAAIDSAKTAQENMVASQRAWVGPRNAKSATGPELEKDLNITIEYQNSGREPALETIFDTEAFVATNEEDVSGSVANRVNDFIGKCKIKWLPTQKGVVFPSGNTSSAYELTRTLEADSIDQAVLDGSKAIFIDGCIVYKSAGGIHRSSFCYFFNTKKTKPGNWNICSTGNDAD